MSGQVNGRHADDAGREADGERLKLGGMALRNGLLINGPTHWAAAVRRGDGSIEIASERKPQLAPRLAGRIPGVRGPLKLLDALAVLPLVRLRMRSARMPFEDPRVLAAVGATFAISTLIRRRNGASASREIVLQALGLMPALAALSDRDLAAYHGVEHKAIAAYEQGIEDPASVPKEHDRCGTNLIVPLMALSIGGNVILERAVEHPGPVARLGVTLAGTSAAVEMFAWSDRNHGSAAAEIFHTPGRELQRHFATREPTAEQLEIGVAALGEILRAESAASGGEPPADQFTVAT